MKLHSYSIYCERIRLLIAAMFADFFVIPNFGHGSTAASLRINHGSKLTRYNFMSRHFLFCPLLMLVSFFQIPVISEAQNFTPFFLDNGNSHQYIGGIYGCGATFSDFDKDGFDDLSLPANGSNPKFYKNVDGVLQEVSFGIQNQDEIKHMVWVDYDNDGDRDLCITGVGMPVRLFNNDGEMNLTDVSLAAGFPFSEDMTYGNCWGDYDRDGDLDVFIAKYDAAYTGMTDADNELYRNNGDGTFTNVANEAGIYFETNYTFMGLWMDYDNDLWPDLLITNDRTEAPNYFFHNNGDGTFTDVTAAAGLDDFIWSMSNTSDDYDNDGDADLYITNGPLGNVHKANSGLGYFVDVTNQTLTKVNRFCWSAQFLDADNDGWLDLHVCSTPISNIPGGVVFFKNQQNYFEVFTGAAGLGNDGGWSRGSALGDINNDGFPDIIVTKTAPDFSTFWQSVPNENNWLKVDLAGTISNVDGIGSRIECYTGNTKYTRFTHCGEAYNAQNSFSEFFGLANVEVVDSLVVFWPSGIVDVWKRIPTNQRLRLHEGNSRWATLSNSGTVELCSGTIYTSEVTDEWSAITWHDGFEGSIHDFDSTDVAFAFVTDEFGNEFLTDSLFLSFQEIPELIPAIQEPSCYGLANGSFELTGVSSEEVSAIVWNDESITGLQGENLGSGIYFYQLTTFAGCWVSDSVVISQPEPIILNIATTDILCSGDSTGTAQFDSSGGFGEHAIQMIPDLNPNQLPEGNYQLILTDENNCIVQSEFSISAPDDIVVTAVIENVSCYGASDGAVHLIAEGGSGSYAFNWNGLDSLQLTAGNYQISLTDSNGCPSDVIFSIDEPTLLTAEIIVTPVIENLQSGSAQLAINGGTTPYTIQWSNGPTNTSIVEFETAGVYAVTISDNNQCEITLEFEIDVQISVSEQEHEMFSIYPNPVESVLFIRNNQGGAFKTRMTDMSGKLLFEKVISGSLIENDITFLSSGVYFLFLESGNYTKRFLFIKR